MKQQELNNVLELHRDWLRGEGAGERANLQGEDLSGANLRGANLQGASLRGADLQEANLSGANLEGANLRDANLRGATFRDATLQGASLRGANLEGANLRGANLRNANLQGASLRGASLRDASLRGADLDAIKADFFEVLNVARDEVLAVYEALNTGKINGSAYKGECACLMGTIAMARNEDPNELTIELIAQPLRAAERWFLAIEIGDIPLNSLVSEITAEWMVEFMDREGITYPRYEIRAVKIKNPLTNKG